MEILSLRENPHMQEWFLLWYQEKWDGDGGLDAFLDSLEAAPEAEGPMPQWYLLLDGRKIVGGLGLMDEEVYLWPELSPWIATLYIAPEYRGHDYGGVLIRRGLEDLRRLGYEKAYLCTRHEGYYERFGFSLREIWTDELGSKNRLYEVAV